MELNVTKTEERQNSVLSLGENVEMSIMSVKENGVLVMVMADINARMEEEGSPAYLGTMNWNRGKVSVGGLELDDNTVGYVEKFKEVVEYLNV